MAKSKKAGTTYKKLNGMSQRQFLVDHLRGTGISLTSAEAKEQFGIAKLGTRMHELKNAGLVVRTTPTGNGNEVAYKVSARDVNGSRAKLAV